MKWLFVTAEFPWPLAHGTHLRVYHLARTLRRKGDETAIIAPAGPSAGVGCFAEAGVTILPQCEPATLTADVAHGRGGPYPFNPCIASALAQHAGGADIVVLVHPKTLHYAPLAGAAGCVVADFLDDPVLEERRRLRRGLHLVRRARAGLFIVGCRRYERRFLPGVQLVTFVSDTDAKSFSCRNRRQTTAVVTNGVESAFFSPPAEVGPAPADGPTVMFLGHMSHPPNADAALFFLREVAPLIRRSEPTARMVVVGPSPPAAVVALTGPKVEVTGWVDDIRPRLWSATVVVLPMRMGTGIKNKLLEAWSARSAVVATARACQGVPAVNEENLLIAETPVELARAAVRLIRDKRLGERLALQGQQTVREHFTWSAAANDLRAAVLRLTRTSTGTADRLV
ncbi:MAG: glycosyltransferase [Planctomycetes bacterium]|nr:glycosyltransferase [Planctomycetota bacterium]